jgi:multiple sugar transport system substrate-binding protein
MKKLLILMVLVGLTVSGNALAAAVPADARAGTHSVQPAAVTELTILWAKWPPADALQSLAARYTEETGIKVSVIQEPWDIFPQTFFAEMERQGTAYDMVVGESMWLGKGAQAGYYLDLTDWLTDQGIAASLVPSTLASFAEYPAGSGKYWAYPLSGNLFGYAYRRDLLEDPKKISSFARKHDYPLGVPENFDQLKEIVEFLTKPMDGIMGIGLYTAMDYQSLTPGIITAGFQSVFFSFGADWHDAEGNIIGVANTPAAAEAAQYYQDLYRCCTALGAADADYETVLTTYSKGLIALAMLNFGFAPLFRDPALNPYADVTGFFANPRGADGNRYAVLGGQGISVVSFISPERQAAALDFLRWLAQDDVQVEWAALTGSTCNKNVVESEEFLSASPLNAAYAESLDHIKDFWNVPQYAELLAIAQKQLHNFVIERTDPAQKVVDNIAEFQSRILQEAGTQ